MFTVTKEFRFEAAHRLARGYEGKCANIHGHSWVARFEVLAHKLDGFGFARDFSEFKPLGEAIDKMFDHALLLCDHDEAVIAFCKEKGFKTFIFPGENPTSEVVARTLFDYATEVGFKVVAVEINETCTSRARYEVR